VREAWCILETAGILEGKIGSGTYMKTGSIDQIYIIKIRDISTKGREPL